MRPRCRRRIITADEAMTVDRSTGQERPQDRRQERRQDHRRGPGRAADRRSGRAAGVRPGIPTLDPERTRLAAAADPATRWRRWGPYLTQRQWGTVREDYSADGTAWEYFPHDHARSRAYRWGEDGIAGISDNRQRLCFSLALWNGRDPILKERLFGLTNAEGNHGEDGKEYYYYLDNTPSPAYMLCPYKYP